MVWSGCTATALPTTRCSPSSWQRDHGDADGLAEFAAVVAELAPAYTRVVELVAGRRGDTIEALHAKSDLQVGMEALLGGSFETRSD